MLIPFVLAAILGVPDAGFTSTPVTPEAVVLQETIPAGAGSGTGLDSSPVQGRDDLLEVLRPSRNTVLIEAQVLEKYRSFRESLTTP